jgi:pilus assembly protein Flp/PilA
MDFINTCLAKLEVMHAMRRDERGVTALEYGLVAAFVGTAIVAAMATLKGDITTLFGKFTTVVGLAP